MHTKDGLNLNHPKDSSETALSDDLRNDVDVSVASSKDGRQASTVKTVQAPSFLPPEERGVSLGRKAEAELEAMMAQRYKRFLKRDECICVETELCHQFARVQFRLNNPSRTTHVELESYLECEANKIDNPIEAYHAVLDIVDLVLLDYFESDRITHYLPVWDAYDCDAKTAHIRFEHRNPALDDEASDFLKAHGFDDSGEVLDDDV